MSRRTLRTVGDLMKPEVYFVPETKLGSELLREMQRDNARLAIVIDEYGGVAGLVTIEDLVEEIVGEIRDEHEKSEVVKESDTSYIFNGNTDVDLLDKLLGVRPGREGSDDHRWAGQRAGRAHPEGRRGVRGEWACASRCWSRPSAASIASASASNPSRCGPDRLGKLCLLESG